MHIARIEPQIAPLAEGAYTRLAPDAPLNFNERQAVFAAAHPHAKEFVILTEEGLEVSDRRTVKQLVLDNTPSKSVYAGIGGRALLLSGRLISPDLPDLQQFNSFFYATGREHWEELDLVGDNNPVKYAVIKAEYPDHPAFIAFEQDKLEPFEPGKYTPEYRNICWSPGADFTTESCVSAVFHVVSLQRLLNAQ